MDTGVTARRPPVSSACNEAPAPLYSSVGAATTTSAWAATAAASARRPGAAMPSSFVTNTRMVPP
jgi:hypothetical protein